MIQLSIAQSTIIQSHSGLYPGNKQIRKVAVNDKFIGKYKCIFFYHETVLA